jgi:hypothetical protein
LGVGQIVPSSIHFNYQLCAVMYEINDVPSHRRLASDVQVESPECFPKGAFAGRHFPP